MDADQDRPLNDRSAESIIGIRAVTKRYGEVVAVDNVSLDIGIFLPKEGAAFNIDVMAIPKDAPHPDNAHKFINYLLEAKVIGAITSSVGYANAVPASREFVAKDINDDPVVYPPADVKLYTATLVTQKFERERNRLWTRIKTGR